MRRGALKAGIVLIIGVIFFSLVSQMFDRWDHAETKGKDTESTLMLIAVSAGAAIAIVHAASVCLPSFLKARLAVTFSSPAPLWAIFEPEISRSPESPPLLALRI